MSLGLLTIFTNPSVWVGYDTRSIFKQSLTGLNSKFSFSWTSCLNKAEEPSQPYYLLIAGGRIIGFIPFSRVFVLCEMQSVLSRIWTRVAMSISYDNNHYTMGTSFWFINSKFLDRSSTCIYFYFFFKVEELYCKLNYHGQKTSKHLCATYGITGQLFWSNKVETAVQWFCISCTSVCWIFWS